MTPQTSLGRLTSTTRPGRRRSYCRLGWAFSHERLHDG